MNHKKKKYGIVALIGITLVILIELMVLCRVLPFDVVFGGTLESYNQVVILAIGNIVCLLILLLAILISSRLLRTDKFQKLSRGILEIICFIGILKKS